MAESPLTARNALAIPHILDLVVGYVAQDCLHRLLQPCRLVCKAWDEAALRHLVASNRIIITNAVCSTERCPREVCRSAISLQEIMRNRPWVLLFVKAVHLDNSAISGPPFIGYVGDTARILQQCRLLHSVRMGGTVRIPGGCVPSTVRHLELLVPSNEQHFLAWRDLLAGLPQLSHLGVRYTRQSRTVDSLPALLAAVVKPLHAFDLMLAFGVSAQAILDIRPHVHQLRRLKMVTLAAVPIAFLDSLPHALEQLSLRVESLAREVILRLADVAFLPGLALVPALHSHDRPVSKTEVRAAIGGLSQRGTVRDMHTAGFKLYRLASDLSDSDRTRLQECEKEGTIFEPAD